MYPLRSCASVVTAAAVALLGTLALQAAPSAAAPAASRGPAVSATAPHDPIGHVDRLWLDETYHQVFATGWAGDLDAGTTPGQRVHVYIDGRGVEALSTGAYRTDVARAYPSLGPGTGFEAAVPQPPKRGTHTACFYAINRGPGANTLLGCKIFDTDLPNDLVGHIDSIVPDPSHANLRIVTGWALNPTDTGSPTPFGILDMRSTNGPVYAFGSAGLPRADVDRAYPRNGTNHGFRITIDVSHTGTDWWRAGDQICPGLQKPYFPGPGNESLPVTPKPHCTTFPG